VQTAQLLRDRPTQIVEHRSVEELVGDLERLGVVKRLDDEVEGEAVEEDV
jgi:hypothetical protein